MSGDLDPSEKRLPYSTGQARSPPHPIHSRGRPPKSEPQFSLSIPGASDGAGGASEKQRGR